MNHAVLHYSGGESYFVTHFERLRFLDEYIRFFLDDDTVLNKMKSMGTAF